jgi:hypothetical protein
MNNMEDGRRNPGSRPWTFKTRENPGSRPSTFGDCEFQHWSELLFATFLALKFHSSILLSQQRILYGTALPFQSCDNFSISLGETCSKT